MQTTAAEPKNTVAVIGAGVLGLCTALQWIRAGYKVSLFDPGEPAGETSSGNASYLAVEYLDPLASIGNILSQAGHLFSINAAFKVTADHMLGFIPWALRFFAEARPGRVAQNQLGLCRLNGAALDAWKDILQLAGAMDELHRSGALALWEDSRKLSAAEAALATTQGYGFDAQLLRGDAVFEKEPALSREVSHALYYPGSYHLSDSKRSCLRLYNYYRHNGGQFLQQGVASLKPNNRGVTIESDGNLYQFDKVVITAGAWSNTLLNTVGLDVPLAAERGYHLSLPHAKGKLNHIISSNDRRVVLSPLSTGLRIVGFGEYGRLQSKPTEKRYQTLEHHLRGLIPQIDVSPSKTRTWMGIRPTLPDSLPVIDLHPQYPQIGMAFGHQHLGVTQAAISSSLIFSLMTEGKQAQAWQNFGDVGDAFAVTRFS